MTQKKQIKKVREQRRYTSYIYKNEESRFFFFFCTSTHGIHKMRQLLFSAILLFFQLLPQPPWSNNCCSFALLLCV